jgi:hypothetical protein
MSLRIRLSFLTLSLANCDAPVETVAGPQDARLATEAALTSSMPTSAVPSASASSPRPSVVAPTAKREPLPLPASFANYSAEVATKCPSGEGEESNAGMVASQIDAAQCQARLMAVDAKKLKPSQRASLLDGDPTGPHGKAPGPTPSRWAETVDAACNVEGAQLWMQGGSRTAGTMEHLRAVGCLSGEDQALGFIMRSWTKAAPQDVVAYVRAFATLRPAPAPRLALWRRYAGLARRTAPHKAEPDCRYMCRWSDAEWIAFERDLDRAEQGARAVSVGLCAEWSELAQAFGGVATCVQEMTSRWLPSSAGMDEGSGDEGDPQSDAQADPPSERLGPPADEGYDAALLALRRSWAIEGKEVAGAAQYLEQIEREVASGSRKDLARWVRRAATWRDRFAVADEQAQFLEVSSATAGWLSAPHKNIAPTSRLLEGYLLRLILAPKEQALREHVLARQAWGKAVESNLGKARDAFSKPCKPGGMRSCDGATSSSFKQVSERIAWLESEGAALGSELCAAAPELQTALGSDCPRLATRYLLAFAKYAGDPELLQEW